MKEAHNGRTKDHEEVHVHPSKDGEKSRQESRPPRTQGVSVKGVSIIRAKPSNVLDAYDLYKRAFKEGVHRYPSPSQKQITDYHWALLEELKHPAHVVLLAKKGRQYLGLCHGIITPRALGPQGFVMFLRLVYVTDKKRKLGVGKKLLDEMTRLASEMGITVCEFMCDDSLVDYWQRERSAKKIASYMIVEA